MKDIFKRIGRFYLDKEALGEQTEAMQAVFSTVLPVKAEFFAHSHRLEYYGYSEHFDILADGAYVPAYIACVEKKTDPKTKASYYHVWWKQAEESKKIEKRLTAYYRDLT